MVTLEASVTSYSVDYNTSNEEWIDLIHESDDKELVSKHKKLLYNKYKLWFLRYENGETEHMSGGANGIGLFVYWPMSLLWSNIHCHMDRQIIWPSWLLSPSIADSRCNSVIIVQQNYCSFTSKYMSEAACIICKFKC